MESNSRVDSTLDDMSLGSDTEQDRRPEIPAASFCCSAIKSTSFIERVKLSLQEEADITEYEDEVSV